MRSGQEVEVLVVGGGPVGLGMAIGLRSLGVGCMVVERHPSTLDFPRGRGITVRTMEIFRRWGLEHDIVTAGLPRGESLYVFSGDKLLSTDFTRVGLPAVRLSTGWADLRVAPCSPLTTTADGYSFTRTTPRWRSKRPSQPTVARSSLELRLVIRQSGSRSLA